MPSAFSEMLIVVQRYRYEILGFGQISAAGGPNA
jgi:hypothetical protein